MSTYSSDSEVSGYMRKAAYQRSVRLWIGNNPWQPDKYGKGLRLRTGRVLLWATNDDHPDSQGIDDGWPWHGMAVTAFDLGASDDASPFYVEPDGTIEFIGDATSEFELLVNNTVQEAFQ